MAEPTASLNLVQIGLISLSVFSLNSFHMPILSIMFSALAPATYWVSSVVGTLLLLVPLLLVQLQLGAKTTRGVVGSIGKYIPLLKGFGISILILHFLGLLYMSSRVGTGLYYTFASLVSPYPWANCFNRWNTDKCQVSSLKNKVPTTAFPSVSFVVMNMSLSDNVSLWEDHGLTWNTTYAEDIPDIVWTPAGEYYKNFVLEKAPVDYLNKLGLGGVSWPVAVSIIAVWFLVFLGSCFGVSAFGKIMYVLGPVVVILFFVVLTYGHVTFDSQVTSRFIYRSYKKSPFSFSEGPFKIALRAITENFYGLIFTLGTVSTFGKYVGLGTKSECPLYFLWVFFIGIVFLVPHCIYAFFAPYFAAYELHTGFSVGNISFGGSFLFTLLTEIFSELQVPNVIAVFAFATITLFSLIGFALIVVVLLDHFEEALGSKLKSHPLLWRILITGIFCTISACLSLVFATRTGSYLYKMMTMTAFDLVPFLIFFIFLNVGITIAYVQLDLPVWSRAVIGLWFVIAFVALASGLYMLSVDVPPLCTFLYYPHKMPDWMCTVRKVIAWLPILGVPIGIIHSLVIAPGTCCQKIGALIIPDTYRRTEEQEDENVHTYPMGSYSPLSQQPRPPPVIEIEDKVTVF